MGYTAAEHTVCCAPKGLYLGTRGPTKPRGFWRFEPLKSSTIIRGKKVDSFGPKRPETREAVPALAASLTETQQY